MKQKMTIHRALAELKLIDAKVTKAIETLTPSGIVQGEQLVNGVYDRKEFEKDAKAKLQSATDLIKRKNDIKSAITKANAETIVTIADKSMTISDAINFKTVIELKKELISGLVTKHNQTKKNLETNNTTIDANALRLAEAALQKDNVKINDGDAVAITEPYLKKNKFHLVDPLGVEKLSEKLQEEIDNFEVEVDAVLSEINALTVIEI